MTYWKDVGGTGSGLIHEKIRVFPWRNWEESWKSACMVTDLQVSRSTWPHQWTNKFFYLETNTCVGSLFLSLIVLILYAFLPGFQTQTKFKSTGRPRGTLSPVHRPIVFLLLSTKFWETANSFWLSRNFLFPVVNKKKKELPKNTASHPERPRS